jgi:hypothetical protein
VEPGATVPKLIKLAGFLHDARLSRVPERQRITKFLIDILLLDDEISP